MAFESCPKDVVNSLHDPGVYYVYEHGRLKAPPGYALRWDSIPFETKQDEKVYPTAATLSPTTGLHKPPSLLHICMDFVAEYIVYVESLVGFPELIGEALFKRIAKKGTLNKPNDDTVKIFDKFCDAYGEMVCKSFVLRKASVSLENCVGVLESCFQSLVVLDLEGCRLGDEHELIPFISRLKTLRKLGLCNNWLSDKAVQRLTTPLRMFKTGLTQLNAINIADNPRITDKGIRYLLYFKLLRELDISRTNVTKVGVAQLLGNTELQKVELTNIESKPCVLGHPQMEGWASDVLDVWIRSADPLINQPGLEAQIKDKTCFYGSKRMKLEMARRFQTKESEKINQELKAVNQKPLVFKSRNSISKEDIIATSETEFCGDQYQNIKTDVNLFRVNAKSPHHDTVKIRKLLSNKQALDLITKSEDGNKNCESSTKRKRKTSDIENPDAHKNAGSKKPKLQDSVRISGKASEPLKEKKQRTDAMSDFMGYSLDEQEMMKAYFSPSSSTKSVNSLFDF